MLLAAVKYIVTLPYAMLIGLEFKYALLTVLAGGIGGFLFFYYLSKWLNKGIDYLWPYVCRLVPSYFKKRYQTFCERKTKKEKKKVFTKKKRFIVRIRKSYGLWGIIIATPVLLTIPIGAFLANKYYSHKKNVVFYMIISIIGWGLVLSGIVHLFPDIFF